MNWHRQLLTLKAAVWAIESNMWKDWSYDLMDDGKLGDSDCSLVVRAADGILRGDECMDLVPNAFWAVPQITSPCTTYVLCWPKNDQNPLDCAVSGPKYVTNGCRIYILINIKQTLLAQGGSSNLSLYLISPISSCL